MDKQEYEAKLAALRAVVDKGDASGIAEDMDLSGISIIKTGDFHKVEVLQN
ncbi:MAG TPA: hypothetical protein VNW97_20550 [Candidatus Saccharimonadales bacterium]|nr:hypothetical protein [Candidatus Saccharimonadales bacterium]